MLDALEPFCPGGAVGTVVRAMSRLMLPGRTAYQPSKPVRTFGRSALVLFAVAGASILIGLQGSTPGIFFIAGSVLLGACCGFAAVMMNAALVNWVALENRYGYTTLPNQELRIEELDPASGRTIRAANEPFSEWKEPKRKDRV